MVQFYNAVTLPEIVTDFTPQSYFLGRCYCSAESRNQWTDWSGTTAMVVTPHGYSLSLENEKRFCEHIRKQGSRFSIKELPLFVFDSNYYRLCFSFSGLYYEYTAKNFIESLGNSKIVVESIIESAKKFNFAVAFGLTSSFPEISPWLHNENLFARISSPGKNGCSMVWTCKFMQMDRNIFFNRLNQYAMNEQG